MKTEELYYKLELQPEVVEKLNKKKAVYVRCSNGENGTCPSIKERTEALMAAYQNPEVQEIYDISG